MHDARDVAILRSLLPIGARRRLSDLYCRSGADAAELLSSVDRLQRCGCTFQLSNEAIALLSEPDALIPELIMSRLRNGRIGREILVFKETSSTNDRARQAGLGGAPEGLVIFSESQTSGRGTQGRRWISKAGMGLWFSILLRSEAPTKQWPLLVKMAAISCAEVIEQWADEKVEIKPPNDLFLGGGKLAGFLLETSNTSDFQILGIGLNIHSAPSIEGYPTAFLESFCRQPVSRNAFAAALLDQFADWYHRRGVREVEPAFSSRTVRRNPVEQGT